VIAVKRGPVCQLVQVAHACRALAIRVSRSRTFRKSNLLWNCELSGKGCFGETPKPTRETRALPHKPWPAPFPRSRSGLGKSPKSLAPNTAYTMREIHPLTLNERSFILPAHGYYHPD
jgi:hypothetical protein